MKKFILLSGLIGMLISCADTCADTKPVMYLQMVLLMVQIRLL